MELKKEMPYLKSGIARKFIINMLLFSFIVTFILTSIQLYVDYSKALKVIDIKLEEIRTVHLQGIINSMWETNYELIKVQLEGILHTPDIQYLAISVDSDNIVSVGSPKTDNIVSRDYPLVYSFNDRQINLGKLQVAISLDGVQRRLISKGFGLLLNNFIVILMLSAFFFFLFYFLAGRHLKAMADYTKQLGFHSLDRVLVLKRSGINKDELDQLVHSINSMREGMATDIAKRKEVEDALKESEERLMLSLEAANAGTWDFNIQTGEVYWDDRMQEIFGLEPGTYDGTYDSWSDMVHPDDRNHVDEVTIQSIDSGMSYECEYRICASNGTLCHVRAQAVVKQDLNGEPLRIAGIAIDITDKKEAQENLQKSEEKYRVLVESANDAITAIDLEGRVTSWNRAAEEMFGYSHEEIKGKPMQILVPEELERERQSLLTIIKDAGFIKGYETVRMRKDGTSVPIEITANLLNDADGRPVGVSGIMRDISERKKLESQLLHAQKMESVGTLAAGVAHDFNNILTAIMGFTTISKRKLPVDDPVQLNLDYILESVDRAADLTGRLLTFSRKQKINRKHECLNKVINNLEKFLVRVIREDIEFKTNLSHDEMTAIVDVNMMDQLFMNLASNARDAMKKGGLLTISTEHTIIDDGFIQSYGYGREGSYALITISDDGTGMDEKTRERIFEPFYTTKEVNKGTGLGMSIVYGIVKQHEGFINVNSVPGEGTTFEIYLPLIKSEEKDECKDKTKIAVPAGGTETILVAEDDEMLRLLMMSVLEDFGYRAIMAADGEEAVNIFMEHKEDISLFVSDVVMPKKSGLEAYEDIRKVRPDIRAIFISGYPSDIIQQKGIQKKELNIIPKPVLPETLLNKITEVLGDESLYGKDNAHLRSA